VVEDEADIAEGLKARLELEGFEVMISGDGEAGIHAARKETPNMIILDVMIPKINGFEVCSVLKNDVKTKDIPILILTALPQLDDAEKAFSAGANDFLNKPYLNDRLLKKVHKLLTPPK
jgi:DNA-binding response OmpR family regulator